MSEPTLDELTLAWARNLFALLDATRALTDRLRREGHDERAHAVHEVSTILDRYFPVAVAEHREPAEEKLRHFRKQALQEIEWLSGSPDEDR